MIPTYFRCGSIQCTKILVELKEKKTFCDNSDLDFLAKQSLSCKKCNELEQGIITAKVAEEIDTVFCVRHIEKLIPPKEGFHAKK